LHQTARQVVPSDVPVSPIDYVSIAGALGVGQSFARLFLRKIEWSFRESRDTEEQRSPGTADRLCIADSLGYLESAPRCSSGYTKVATNALRVTKKK
jgi:hypothetical protein